MVERNQNCKMQKMLLLFIYTLIVVFLILLILKNYQSISKKIYSLLWDKNKIKENFNGRDENRSEMIKILQSSLIDPDTVNLT